MRINFVPPTALFFLIAAPLTWAEGPDPSATCCLNPSYRVRTQRRYPPNSPPPAALSLDFDAVGAFRGQDAIEIGGPSEYFQAYDEFASLTLIDSPDAKKVLRGGKRADEGETVTVFTTTGQEIQASFYARRAEALTGFGNESFGVVLAFHVLEHTVDPLRVLLEWDRVLKQGGLLFLILPFAPNTFDKHRHVSTSQRLHQLYHERIAYRAAKAAAQAAALRADGGIGGDGASAVAAAAAAAYDPNDADEVFREWMEAELDLSSRLYPEAIEGGSWPHNPINGVVTDWAERKAIIAQRTMIDVDSDGGGGGGGGLNGSIGGDEGGNSGDALAGASSAEAPASGGKAQRIGSLAWHWHVWDFDLLHEVVGDCLGYELAFAGYQDPYHQLLMARKPHRRAD